MDLFWQEFEACINNGYSPEEAKEIASRCENNTYDMIEDTINHLNDYDFNKSNIDA